jgi:hypothetical protein
MRTIDKTLEVLRPLLAEEEVIIQRLTELCEQPRGKRRISPEGRAKKAAAQKKRGRGKNRG